MAQWFAIIYQGGLYMFTKIKLHNFKSFEDIELDLTTRKSTPKHLAIVYGENGMGKSNLAESIAFLIDLLRTMDVRDIWAKMIEDTNFNSMGDDFLGFLRRQLREMKNLISDNYMIGAVGNMKLQYEFSINDRKGLYEVTFHSENGELSHERLEYTLEKNRGVYFDITPDEVKLNKKAFVDNQFLADLQELVRKFWGKHTLLAILLHEEHDKSTKYIHDAISINFASVLDAFSHISCFLKTGHEERGYLQSSVNLPRNLESGEITADAVPQLNKVAEMLSSFFHAINSDNRKVYFDFTSKNEKQVSYQLYVSKLIYGKERDIPFSLESTGNHRILDIISFLFEAMNGHTVVIDEIDMGIHDVLMKKVIEEVAPHISGQLIVTSHNTLLMEIDSIRDAIYIISEDENAYKQVKCISDYAERTYLQNNIRNKYLNADYDGIPHVEQIEFSELFQSIQ